ncbi:hypothetical protein IFM89_019509 [Coptis chinensis]|uniref:Uncharacterized protein n=1 Tax=Coptis chinensis TaxID=261450 RepID=A0A835LVP3_9MAGN|nr:hypothetical protein IFM89_007632 [Coptis chinensis]KAF9609953.1 hypothetical protein IFM89_019509 [Coptis chinensis]
MRKPVLSTKTTEERKVDSKGFESMKLLKKGNHEIFVKLGSENDGAKRKEDANSKADKVKKVSQAQNVLMVI